MNWLRRHRLTALLMLLVTAGYWLTPPQTLLEIPFWSRPLLSPFVSAHWLHLASNLLALFLLGASLESKVSWQFLLLVFLPSTTLGAAISQWMRPESLTVGCSAASYATLAVFIYLLWWNRETTAHLSAAKRSFVTFILIYICVLGMQPHQVAGITADHIQHLVGFLWGAVTCVTLRKSAGRIYLLKKPTVP